MWACTFVLFLGMMARSVILDIHYCNHHFFSLILVQIHVQKNVRTTRYCLRQYRHSRKVSLCFRPQSIVCLSSWMPHMQWWLYLFGRLLQLLTLASHYLLKCVHSLNNIFVYNNWCNICPPDLQQKNASLKEKQHAISEVISQIQQKETQKDDIIRKIEKLKEEQAKRKESKLILRDL